ncbi:MAG TPA: hypothetical protein VE547_05995 [Mycobacteriales bacterium]|nr:hypothetical protein [Mycobacteriales bacterium]
MRADGRLDRAERPPGQWSELAEVNARLRRYAAQAEELAATRERNRLARVRRHGWRPIGEMCAAMYVAFLVLMPAYWAGLIDGDALLGIGHVLMLPLMLAALLREHRNPLRSAVSSLR